MSHLKLIPRPKDWFIRTRSRVDTLAAQIQRDESRIEYLKRCIPRATWELQDLIFDEMALLERRVRENKEKLQGDSA